MITFRSNLPDLSRQMATYTEALKKRVVTRDRGKGIRDDREGKYIL